MSTQEINNATGEKTELVTGQYDPTEVENVSQKSPCTELRDSNCEELVTDKKDDQYNGQCSMLIGDHENQVSEGGEADLPLHKKNCKKNPGHPEFIPIESFSLRHLPECHQDLNLYEFIKVVADLTVKVSVHMTSADRPEFWPNTKIPYFLSPLRGMKILRTGTGRISGVRKFTDEDKHWKYGCTTCQCDKCKASDKPSKIWWEIDVDTAAHVVVDDIEASHTTLRLFFDREDSKVVILKDKVCVDDVNIERDRCWLSCVTCDQNLGNKLETMIKHFVDVWEKVKGKFYKSRDTDQVNFIVSHPHGCDKQVSIGQWKNIVWGMDDEDKYQFTYKTCTCPGSSGASVHYVGHEGWMYGYVHSGSSRSGLNYSAVY